MKSWRITVWCETDDNTTEQDISDAIERIELSGIQYQIEGVRFA